jgi:hypothetical protein
MDTESHESRRLFAERAAWFVANEPPSFYGPNFCSMECESANHEELDLQRFTVEYLRRQIGWHPRCNTCWRDYAVEAAAASVHAGLCYLNSPALREDPRAAESLASFALQATKTLADLTETQFKVVKAFAETQRWWPILKSLHQHFDSDHMAILSRLEVGVRNPLNIYKGKWNPTDEVGELALGIWDRFEYLRTLPYPWGIEHWLDAERRACNLAPFSPDTCSEWCEFAEAYVRETYSTQEDVKSLNEIVKAPSRRIPSYKLGSVHKISSHFFTMLKGKFRSMAGCNRD